MKLFRVLKEVLISSLPLALVIIIVCGFVAPMENAFDYVKLAIGYASVVVGQAFFLTGLDMSILPVGKHVGGSLGKINRAWLIIFIGFLFGLLSTVAEPALTVLAKQTHMLIDIVDETAFVWIMSTGIGVFVALAMYRIMKNMNIKHVFALLYILVFAIVFFVPEEFVALSFDGSGATTGDISVPFILALGLGIANTLSKSKTNEDTFGIIGIASVGPILSLFIYGIILKIANGGVLPPANAYTPGAADSLGSIIVSNLGGVTLALVPVIVVFLPFQFFLIKLSKRELLEILFGVVTVFVGLLIFLSGIDFGFAFAGKYIGEVFLDPLRSPNFKWWLLVIGFILGAAITLSEPAVVVLGEQLEEITNGHISKKAIRYTLAIGIGFAVLLSMVNILTQVNILWFLIPLYAIALLLLKYTPGLFVGLAFDSGGVTGGALTSAFLTPLTLGVAQAVARGAGPDAPSILTNGFGIIAFISVTPLIAVQALGILYEWQFNRTRKLMSDANQLEIEELVRLAAQEDTDEPAQTPENEQPDDAILTEVEKEVHA